MRKRIMGLPVGRQTTLTRMSRTAETVKPISELVESVISIGTMVWGAVLQHKVAQKELHTPTTVVDPRG